MKLVTINGLDFKKLNEEELDAIKYYINRRLDEIEEGLVIERTWYYYAKIYIPFEYGGTYSTQSITKEQYDLFKKYMDKVICNGEAISDNVELIESFNGYLEDDPHYSILNKYLKAINTHILKTIPDIAITGKVINIESIELLVKELEEESKEDNINGIVNFLIS